MTALTMRDSDTAPPWEAQDYAIDAGFRPVVGSAVVRLLDARCGERILDLGCGDGVLGTELALGGAHVTGVDVSSPMVVAARARGLDAQRMDGHALAFDGVFDAVFSNAALHWMHEPDRVLAGVRRALKPGGRFVAEFGAEGNMATLIGAVQSARVAHGHEQSPFTWYFPSAAAYADRLRQHGFHVQYIETVQGPAPLPAGVAGWLEGVGAPLLADLDVTAADRVRAAARALLEPAATGGPGCGHDVRLRLLARRR